MRCINCASLIGADEVVYAPYSNSHTLQPYCPDCEPPDYPETEETPNEGTE